MDFFAEPAVKTPPSAETSAEQPTAQTPPAQPEPPKNEPKAAPSSDPLMDFITQPTEHREEKQTNPETEPGADGEEPSEEPVTLDAEGIEFASELATNANTMIMGQTLSWMDGENPAEDFQPAPGGRDLIKKAWARFFEIVNINITANKGVLYANLVAYAWHLMATSWKFFGRLISGKVRFPWSKKPEPQPEPEIEFQPGGPAPDFHGAAKNATSRKEQAVKKVAKFVKDNAQDAEILTETPKPQIPDAPKKVCLETGQPFTPGEGFPRSKENPVYDKFSNRAAWQRRRERIMRENDIPQTNADRTPEQQALYDKLMNQQ